MKAIVISKLGPLSYLVETENKLLWRRHIDHLKKLKAKLTCVSETPETDDPYDEVIVTTPVRSNPPDT